MQQPTDRTAPAHTPEQVEQLIAEGRAATGILPTIADCQRLEDALRPVVGALAEQVRRRQGYLPHPAADWQRCEEALLQAQRALLGTMGPGLRSAALHVAGLADAADTLRGAIRVTG